MEKIGRMFLSLLLLGSVLSDTTQRATKYGYTVYEGVGMYRLGEVPATTGKVVWSEALAACMDDGAKLAIINSEKEADALTDFVSSSKSNFFYIGFSDLYIEGEYVTIDGKRIQSVSNGTPIAQTGYTRWYNGVPNGGNTTNCGAVSKSMELTDQNCNTKYPYICEMPLWRNYELVPELGYYSFQTVGETWKNAVKKCEEDGAHLVIIDSSEEAQIVNSLFAEHPILPNVEDPDYIHIGYHDIYKEDLYMTLGGETLHDKYTSWSYGEPKRSNDLNTVRLNRHSSMFMSNGSVGHAYICEHEFTNSSCLFRL